MIKAVIAGTRHRASQALIKILSKHPDVEIVSVADPVTAGSRVTDLMPTLMGDVDLTVTKAPDLTGADVLFLALAPGESRALLRTATMEPTVRIVDLSGDYVTADETHDFVQGIAELNRKSMVRGATHVATPDATAQAIALGLLPLAKNLLLNRPITVTYVTDDPELPEGSLAPDSETRRAAIEAEVVRAVTALQSSFNAPLTVRGFRSGKMAGTVTAITTAMPGIDVAHSRELYDDYYDDHNFVFVANRVDADHVRGTNKAVVAVNGDGEGNYVVTTALDTDMKGGAGNAVHCMNLLFGLHECVGL